jgi:hypothetical protein
VGRTSVGCKSLFCNVRFYNVRLCRKGGMRGGREENLEHGKEWQAPAGVVSQAGSPLNHICVQGIHPTYRRRGRRWVERRHGTGLGRACCPRQRRSETFREGCLCEWNGRAADIGPCLPKQHHTHPTFRFKEQLQNQFECPKINTKTV